MTATKFATRLVHGGETTNTPGAGVSPTIELSTSFVRHDPTDAQEFTYSRSDNPNRRALEKRLASIEDAYDSAAFSSGSAAAMALFQTLPRNSHIIVTEDAYYGVIMLLNDLVLALGHEVTPIDTTRISNVTQSWRENTRLVWLETPSNPQMRIADIAGIAELARSNGAALCCDNTMATIVMQHPLALGADFTMHSSTKFIGGHSDITGGVIVAREDSAQFRRLREVQALAGATPSPFDCWLLQRSIATLGLRVRQQTHSAARVAEFLQAHDSIDEVRYAGLTHHPQAELIARQMTGGGAVLSFLVRGGRNNALQVARNTHIIKQATSLGGVESLIEHRLSVEGKTSLSPDNLLRLSVGLEDADDLIGDLAAALKGQQPVGLDRS